MIRLDNKVDLGNQNVLWLDYQLLSVKEKQLERIIESIQKRNTSQNSVLTMNKYQRRNKKRINIKLMFLNQHKKFFVLNIVIQKEEAAEIEQSKVQHNEELNQKYDYKNKKIVSVDENVEDENNVIRQFSSGFLKQLEEGRVKISQEEVLRSHVKNWKMLSMKQRRIVLNFINARRARDAKKEFLKELNLFGQKVAHDNLQSRITKVVPQKV